MDGVTPGRESPMAAGEGGRTPATAGPWAEGLTVEEVAARAARAREAARGWAARSVRERVRMVRRLWEALEGERPRLARVLHEETGKPLAEIDLMEFGTLRMIVRYFARNAPRLLRDRKVSRPWFLVNKRTLVRYLPRGVVGLITPWNFPLMIPLGDSIPALLAGNAVLLKPSEWTTRIALEVEAVLRESGVLPEGVFQVLPGDGLVGAALIEHVDMVLFTGSTRTGKRVAQAAAARLIPAVLELGGKHAMIVLSDAALDRAAQAAVWGRFANCGQACIGVERVYVERQVYSAFVERVVDRVARLRQGSGSGYDVDLGRIIFPPQVETIARHLDDARARGARIVGAGVVDREGLVVAPTLVLDATADMLCMREETFGPVLPIAAVDGAEEALAAANASPLGLAGSIWTRDLRRAEELGRRMEVGILGINDLLAQYAVVSLPFGGLKESGVGRRHGEEGLRMFCVVQAVMEHRWPANLPELWWFPYGRRKVGLVEAITRRS